MNSDEKQVSETMSWGQTPLFARDSFAPVFSNLGDYQVVEAEKFGRKLRVTLHPEEALARESRSKKRDPSSFVLFSQQHGQ